MSKSLLRDHHAQLEPLILPSESEGNAMISQITMLQPQFTPEEQARIIHLRTVEHLMWRDIANQFENHTLADLTTFFYNRSNHQGGYQGHREHKVHQGHEDHQEQQKRQECRTSDMDVILQDECYKGGNDAQSLEGACIAVGENSAESQL
jgi:hypothetical protein